MPWRVARVRVRRVELGEQVRTEAPVRADQPEHVVPAVGVADRLAVGPPAVEHEPVDGLGMVSRPLRGHRRPERGADQVEPVQPQLVDDSQDGGELELHRPRTVVRRREATAGPVVAHQRAARGQGLVEPSLDRQLPPELEVTQPAGHQHQGRAGAGHGERDRASALEGRGAATGGHGQSAWGTSPAASTPARAASSSWSEVSPETPTAPSRVPSAALTSTPPGTGTSAPTAWVTAATK